MFENQFGLLDLVAPLLASALVAGLLGLLERSRLRSRLMWIWALAPLCVPVALIATTGAEGFGFIVIVTLVLLIPWAAVSLLTYNLVRRTREIQEGN